MGKGLPTVTIEENALSLRGKLRIALETRIHDGIVALRVEHLGLRAVLGEEGSEKGGSGSTVFGVIGSRGDGLVRDEIMQ